MYKSQQHKYLIGKGFERGVKMRQKPQQMGIAQQQGSGSGEDSVAKGRPEKEGPEG